MTLVQLELFYLLITITETGYKYVTLWIFFLFMEALLWHDLCSTHNIHFFQVSAVVVFLRMPILKNICERLLQNFKDKFRIKFRITPGVQSAMQYNSDFMNKIESNDLHWFGAPSRLKMKVIVDRVLLRWNYEPKL